MCTGTYIAYKHFTKLPSAHVLLSSVATSLVPKLCHLAHMYDLLTTQDSKNHLGGGGDRDMGERHIGTTGPTTHGKGMREKRTGHTAIDREAVGLADKAILDQP